MMAARDAGSARRRRERRLRMHLRHERLSVAMALAAALHHSSDGGRGTHSGPRAQTTARAGPVPAELFELYSEDGRPGGLRPPPLAEVRPQDVGDAARRDGHRDRASVAVSGCLRAAGGVDTAAGLSLAA